MEIQAAKGRYGLPDTIRGICLISMVLYHGGYDLVAIYGLRAPWFYQTLGYVWQQSICWTFILLSGFCWSFGKKPLKRGLVTAGCGCVISIVTALIMPEQIVLFGILTFMGSAMILMIPVEKIAGRVTTPVGLAVSILLFAVSRNINRGELGFEGLTLLELLWNVPDSYILEWLGLPSAGFYSTDYFSVVPWFFLYLSGYFLWRLVEKRGAVQKMMHWQIPLLAQIGRRTLLIYIIHQPILMILFTVIIRGNS